MAVYHTADAAGTVELGRRIAGGLKAGAVVAFYGELGAGKTTMIKGICAGLGVKDSVKSPSFVIISEYQGRLPVYHIDLYRIEGGAALAGLGIDSYIVGDGVCLIEWAERMEALLPEGTVRVRLAVEGTGRRIEVEGLSEVQNLTCC
ncbi:MAG: tRNA (adenosine(37)-N6)-threonylcarbamoyltransferase complex ATPase subunit type 1 TsaE [candidate division WOR-3 bacterium]